MTKRKKNTGPPKSDQDHNFSTLRIDEHDHYNHQMEQYRRPAADTSRTSSSRYDSGIDSVTAEYVENSALSDVILEDLEDPFTEDEDELYEELIPVVASTPARTTHLSVGHGFRRRNGSLTPNSRRRLRTLSEGSHEDFQYELNYGQLSHPDIYPEVVAARLSVYADQITPSLGLYSGLNSVSHALIMRLLAVADRMEREYFTQPPTTTTASFNQQQQQRSDPTECHTTSSALSRSLFLGSVIAIGSAAVAALWHLKR